MRRVLIFTAALLGIGVIPVEACTQHAALVTVGGHHTHIAAHHGGSMF